MRSISLGIFFLLSFTITFHSGIADNTTSKRIVFLGDSLTEGYGLSKDKAFPAIVEKKLLALGKKVQTVNSGVSGSTSASGLTRVRWILKNKPDLLVLALGANDGLRGTSIETMKKNLSQVIEECQKNNVPVVLAGMKMPPNYGKDYTRQFETTFLQLAQHYKLPFIPFLLEGVGGVAALNLPDGIHPNEKGYEVVADTVTKALVPLL